MTGQPPTREGPSEVPSTTPALSVVWVGDATLVERYVSRRAPHVRILACGGPDMAGLLQQAVASQPAPDVLVVDTTQPAIDPVQALDVVKSQGLDLPVVLITPPSGKDEVILQISRLAVCDCVVKTEDFVYQMLPAFSQVRARHDLHAVFRASRESEEHLRHILEMQPAVVFVLDAETRITAMNRAGLALLSAAGDKVVGQRYTAFLPLDEQPAIASLIERACTGQAGELDHQLTIASGEVRRVRTHVVSLPRTTGNVALATLLPAVAAPASDGLDQEVERLTRAMAEARAEADAIRAEAEAAEARWLEDRQATHEAHVAALEERDVDQARLVVSLESRVRELEGQLGQAASVHDIAESERSAFAERERSLQEAIAERERSIEGLGERVRALEASLADRERAQQELVADYERRLQESADRERGLEEDRDNRERILHEESATREHVLQELAERERALRDELAAKERQFTERFAAREQTLSDALRESEARHTHAVATLVDLQADRDARSAELAELRAQVSTMGDECARLSSELDAARSQVDALASRDDSDRKTLAERERMLREELAERERALLEDLANRERTLGDEAAAREQTLAEVLRESEARQAQAASTLLDLETARERLVTELSEARTLSSGLSAECARLSNELEAARRQVEETLARSEHDRQALTEREQTLRGELDGLDRALRAELAERERELRSELADRERELVADLATRERSLSDTLAVKDRDLADIQAQCESFIADCARLTGELEAARSRADALAARTESAAEEERRDLFELRELLIDVLFEADQRYRTPRSQRQAPVAEPEESKRQSFLSFPQGGRVRPAAGSRDR